MCDNACRQTRDALLRTYQQTRLQKMQSKLKSTAWMAEQGIWQQCSTHVQKADKLAGWNQVVVGDAYHDLLIWCNPLQNLLQL